MKKLHQSTFSLSVLCYMLFIKAIGLITLPFFYFSSVSYISGNLNHE